MPYRPRPQLHPLPAFAGTARTGTVPSQRLQAQLEAFVLAQYAAGRSLRQIAELIDRSRPRSAACSTSTGCRGAPSALQGRPMTPGD